MSTQPGQGGDPDQDSYGGYAGYQPRKPTDDPYGAYYQPGGSQQNNTTETGKQQSDPNYVYGQKQQQGQSYRSTNGSTGTSSGQQQQQQSSTYQPPNSASGQRHSSSSRTSGKLEPRYAAVLSYLGICFTGLFFFFWERKDRLVRFSAAQSIVLFLPLLIIGSILNAIIKLISGIWIIGWIIGSLLGAVLFLFVMLSILLWLFLMFQAYRGVEVKLPYVGEYAEKLLSMFSPRQKKGV